MKKTKCMGTSKNKRAMSGGRGKISRYTQKFKRSYNRFIKIGDDANSRSKKIEEWGRMRGIYKFLKFQNDKYTGSDGKETTAWEKMKDNDDYKSAISCFEQSDNHILSEGDKCIPEEDYMKGDAGAPDADVVAIKDPYASNDADNNENAAVDADNTDANAEVTPVVDTENDNDAETPVSDDAVDAPVGDAENDNDAEAPAPVAEDSSTPSDVSNDAETPPPVTEDSSTPSDVSNDTEAPAPVAEDSSTPSDVSNDAETPPPVTEDSSTPSDVSNDAEATAEVTEAAADVPSASEVQPDADAKEQVGGRSKRKPKSSRRRRGKSMKSKKGRRTRRKHRAGRH